jgi:hypothetical protein
MYYDEFARRPARPISTGEKILPSLVMEVGGGLSLALAASLNRPISLMVFDLGGLLPMVACCLSIAGRNAVTMVASLAPKPLPIRSPALPAPHFAASRRPIAASRQEHRRVGSPR